MKLRRIAASALALALGVSASAPALAADSADARLAQVTLAVKATLDIQDEYTEFYGEPNETYLGTKWQLSWAGEDKSLEVTATEAGKVLAMYRRTVRKESWDSGFGPSFPAMTRQEAKVIADEFLARVLTQGETVELADEGWDEPAELDVSQYSFSGTVYLNGLPTPMTFRLWVDVADRAVSSFWRGDESDYAGQPPAPDTVTTGDAARAKLAGTLDLELIYVRDGDRAVLRYVPRSTDDFYVDAATGELVNLTELRARLYEEGSRSGGSANKLEVSMDAAEAAPEAAPTLSPTELEGVAKLEGVLSKEELDGKIRAWRELGLQSFELSGCSYSVEREEPLPVRAETDGGADESAVTARLTYTKKTDDGIARRYLTLDAKTGEFRYMGGYDPYTDRPGKLNHGQAQAKGEAFLKALWGEEFAKTELYSSTEAESRTASESWVFTFDQKVNGYFFPENTMTVRVSAADGSIMGFSKSFREDVSFDSAEGLISLEQAKTAWAGSFDVALRYLAVPVKLDMLGAEARPLVNAGYSYFNALRPGYELGQQDGWYYGVDAKTGELVKDEYTEPEKLAYDDIDGHWARAALEELARYNVGWWGGKADPDGKLTQAAYIALLASSEGYRYDPEGDELDDLYRYAVGRGFLTKEERDEDRELTRGEMVKMLLDSLGYKAVANLPGIFRCDYADADTIPAGLMGYAALAQGLGLVKGDAAGRFAAARGASRAEGAVLLWQYMKR